MADLSINMLPVSDGLTDDSLLVVYQNNKTQSIRGELIKRYARESTQAYVEAAQNAAAQAEQAAKDAQAAADSVAYVTEKAEEAAQAALAAQQAKEAAETARQAAEQAAALAAQQAAQDVESALLEYLTQAEQARDDAQSAAQTAANETAAAVEADMKGYVSEAQAAQAAAEKAKADAESAAETAAGEATNLVETQLTQYVADAQAAKIAAEAARDEAQAFAGGDFVSVSDIVNDLVTNVSNKPLSAAQGVALKALIDAITVPTKTSQLTNDSGYLTSAPVASVNGKTGAVTLSASEVGAAPTSHGNHVPATETANNARFLRNDNTWQTITPAGIGAAAAADIATTKMQAMSNSTVAYVKISDFGAWGTGAWYQKGFSMLITSRGGEMIWLAVSSDDSNTNAKAIRLLNTYSKIAGVYYSSSESAVYVKVNAWCNNINAHILSNVNGDYVPTVATASALASDAVEVKIAEFGQAYDHVAVGRSDQPVKLRGSAARPLYNDAELALMSDLNRTTAVNAADTNYTTLMARGTSLNSAETTPAVNGAIAWTYE